MKFICQLATTCDLRAPEVLVFTPGRERPREDGAPWGSAFAARPRRRPERPGREGRSGPRPTRCGCALVRSGWRHGPAPRRGAGAPRPRDLRDRGPRGDSACSSPRHLVAQSLRESSRRTNSGSRHSGAPWCVNRRSDGPDRSDRARSAGGGGAPCSGVQPDGLPFHGRQAPPTAPGRARRRAAPTGHARRARGAARAVLEASLLGRPLVLLCCRPGRCEFRNFWPLPFRKFWPSPHRRRCDPHRAERLIAPSGRGALRIT